MVTVGGFFKKVVLPIAAIGLLLLLFKPIYMVDGTVDFFYLWLLVGIPFGMRKMCMWFIPHNYDIGGTAAIFALNFIIGGLIGGGVAIVRIIQAIWYCMRCVGHGIKMVMN